MATLGAKPVREVSRADANLPTFGGGGATPPPLMERGTMLANGRYEILEILGQGAMGAVYKAKDHELDRWVAIKVIQPELSSSSAMLKRFKQELIMARQVTHRNVIRIFDIGETDGMKFITMEYIDGGDLKSVIIERGKIPPEEAVGIVRQICHALDAAHTEGVVHRDLKPQNIMIDQNDRVVVMDFGIAQSKELPGMTMTGALMGTPEYMSPEQAKGDKTDMRADIFAVGIIFYEMLIGKVPFKAKTVVETMYKRTQERAVPPVDLDSSVPIQANRIVMKCLETDPAARYQSAKELLQDLEAFDPEQKISALDRVRRTVKQRSRFVATMAAVLAVILVTLAAGFLLRDRLRSREVTHPPETVLVADFSNHTGNPIFDGTLEPVVKLGLEGAGFITAYDRSQLRALGAKPVAKLDETTAGQVAVSVGVGVVVSGSLDQQGNEFLVRMKATRVVSGNTIVSTEGTASNKDQVMFETGRLVSAVRRALGDETPEASQRFALETFTNASLEVVHEYILATQAQSNSNNEEALKGYARSSTSMRTSRWRTAAWLSRIKTCAKTRMPRNISSWP